MEFNIDLILLYINNKILLFLFNNFINIKKNKYFFKKYYFKIEKNIILNINLLMENYIFIYYTYYVIEIYIYLNIKIKKNIYNKIIF